MRSKENVLDQFKNEFLRANVVSVVADKSFFSGVIDAVDVREFGVGMIRRKPFKVSFVFDIEENKYFFTDISK